jgi:hypothetical protein
MQASLGIFSASVSVSLSVSYILILVIFIVESTDSLQVWVLVSGLRGCIYSIIFIFLINN